MTESDAKVIRPVAKQYVLSLPIGEACMWAFFAVCWMLAFKCNGVVLWGPNEMTLEQRKQLGPDASQEAP